MDGCKPRINGSQLTKFVGSYVTLVGKTQGYGSTNSTKVTMETSDNRPITLHFPKPLEDPLTIYVEVIGQVQRDCSIRVEKAINWGNEFDLEAYNQLVELMPQFPSMFPMK